MHSSRPSMLEWLVFAAGVGLALFGALSDLFSIGAPGFGMRQLWLAAGGVLLAIVGLPRSRRWLIDGWLAMPKTNTGQSMILIAWFGMLTGFVEVGHQLVRKQMPDFVLGRPDDHVWIPPVVYLCAFGGFGIAFAPIRKLFPRLFNFPVHIFAMVWLLTWSQGLFYPTVDRVALLVLSAGVAFQAARVAARHRRILIWTIYRTLPLMLVAAGVVATLVTLQRLSRESAIVMASNEHEASPDAPNVVLIVLDTVRADHLATYGYERNTMPTLDKLAEAGAVFEHAFSTSPWTLPAHATLFTGHYHSKTSADWLSPLDDEHPTLAEVLSDNGYLTGAFIGNLNYCSSPHGVARGFARFDDFALNLDTLAFCTILGEWMFSSQGLNFINKIRNNAEHVTDRCLQWLEGIDDDSTQPFFAFINYFDAHGLYLTHPDYQSKYGDVSTEFIRRWINYADHTPEELQRFIDAYDGCTAFIDHHLARLIDGLAERGVLDNTLLIITGDHGEQFGEHGLFDHSNSLYRQLLHVPMVFHFPSRIDAGQRFAAPVTIRDLPATILEFAGADPQSHAIPGTSLTRFWSADPDRAAAPGSPVLSEVSKGIRRPAREPISKGDMKSLVEGSLQLIRNGDGKLELYDLIDDPAQIRNLAHDPAFADRVRAMNARIDEIP